MKKIIYIVVGICLLGSQVHAQSLRVANRYYKEYAYEKAISIYKELYQKGNHSKEVVVGIANAYYMNSETELASKWYKKIANGDVLVDEELFRFAQCERSNGNYQVSDSILSLVKNQSLTALHDKTNFLISEENNKYNRISVRNLAINTEYSDFGASIFKDKVYFASSAPKNQGAKKKKLYKWNGQPYLNIYTASSYIEPLIGTERDSILELKDKKILAYPVSTEFHESNAVITKDGKTMYFTRMNTTKNGKKSKRGKKNTINLKIYRASYINGIWANITDLPFNSKDYSVGHPALSPDEKTLYFTSDMPSSLGSTDIFKVAIHADGTYGSPVNLGPSVNTKNKEMFPFVGADNTLYFSSNGHLGLGLLDVFQVKIQKDGMYSEVSNLGFPFNSERDDFAFYINENGSKGFFTSNRKHGKGDDDIYSFIIYKDIKVCKQIIAGVVRNSKTNEPIENVTVSVFDESGKIVKRLVTDAKGHYELNDLECKDAQYSIKADKLDYKAGVSKVVKTLKLNPEATVADLFLDPLIQGNQIVINPIYFDFNKHDIRPDAAYELEHVVTVMKNHPEMKIKIESHTDSRGNANYNRTLSDKRAKSTRDYIVSRGIDYDRIVSAKGFGEDQLLNDCGNNSKCSDEEHQVNRRSYFYIINSNETSSVD